MSKTALAVDISQRTVRVAESSIWTGVLLSTGLLLAATYGLVPAVAGALLQELVDLATILNALRALGEDRSNSAAAITISAAPVPRRVQNADRGRGQG
ncbi:hypothetical protein [Arthrobacter sp. CJ23]|uniref:hypothetical protein n=1 Tax=Arthrobacter sp. CJ23 TaxID=2972479 RepID=UPI00215C4A84|nr:hypothetical protein [Arthrobacter sp. CJ23]UVJ41721.1 hypothetical protein NVV90_09000 [Arthrobacter sp. CJ23]